MKTDDLIAMLSTNAEPVDRRTTVRAITAALAAGAALAVLAMLSTLGVRTDIGHADRLYYMMLKLIFTIAIVALASIGLMRLGRPGGERNAPIGLVVLPFLAIVLLAIVSLASAPHSHWDKMIAGDQWFECLVSIPVIAALPFAAVVWAVRKTAPTDLVRAGAFAGLVAGGLSATAYAFHCTDDWIPFVALWYGGTMVLCTLAGAMLGPRLLRW